MTEEQNIPILRVLKSIVLSISSNRTPPRILLKPPIEVTIHSSLQVLTPIQYAETFLGRKLITETQYSAIVYFKEKTSDQLFRVMEATITFMHIIEPHENIENIINMPPNKLAPGIAKQLINIALQESIPILVMLFDKHMVPVILPIRIHVEYKCFSEQREE